MAGPPLRIAWLGIAIAISGCVNNYVVGDEGSTSVVAAEDTSSADMTAAETDIVDGGTVCSDPVCVGSTGTTVATMGDGNSAAEGDGASGGGDTGLPAMGRAPCDPCETDLHCGGEFDLCVDLGGPSPVCTTRCFEQPECSRGAACQAVISVEGQSADQCVPLAECPAAGTMDETDGV